jgi:TRAP-type C4-dicarboxylate transport system permease small subunit
MSYYLFFASMMFSILYAGTNSWSEVIYWRAYSDILELLMKVSILALCITGWVLYFIQVGVISLHFGG